MSRKLLAAGLVAGLSALLANTAPAQEPTSQLPDVPAASPPISTCGHTVQHTICMRQVYLQEEQSATTIPKLTTREVIVGHKKATAFEIQWNEQKFSCTELVLKPHTVTQQVTCSKIEPVTQTNPSTGQCCTVYRQVPVVKTVTITVYEAVPQEKSYIVRTPCLKPVEKDMVVKQIVVDCTTEPAIEKRLHAITVPCEAHVEVPVPAPRPCLAK